MGKVCQTTKWHCRAWPYVTFSYSLSEYRTSRSKTTGGQGFSVSQTPLLAFKTGERKYTSLFLREHYSDLLTLFFMSTYNLIIDLYKII